VSDDGPSIDPDEIGCQPVLLGPPRSKAPLDPATFTGALDAALAGGGIAAFLLDLQPAERGMVEGGMVEAAAQALRPVCARHRVAFLVQGDARLALAVGADGVLLSDPAAVEAARLQLGPKRILGAACASSRDAAIDAGEAGADYVAFGTVDAPPEPAVVELLAWWQELFVLPSLVLGATTLEQCHDLATAGADLVAAGDLVWAAADGPAAGAGQLRAALRDPA
jgi:thiamine-phosphate pyrophosphorylase